MSFIIAEIGTSHEGVVEKAKALIDCAVESGCDAVKFQWVYADEILHPNTGFVKLPTGNIRLYDRFKSLECSSSFYKTMLDYAHEKGVKFICSPFGLKSLDELLSINPDFIKIASPELNYYQMLKKLAIYRDNQKRLDKNIIPVIISSGVSTLMDIENALYILGVDKVTVLHCITSYPAPADEYNLKIIANLRNIFGVNVGVSDHSLDPILVPTLSVLCGATIIEKHITLSKSTKGLDDPVALTGEQFGVMVHCVHQCEAAIERYGIQKGHEIIFSQLEESYSKEKIESVLGDGVKKLAPSERMNYKRTNRSLHFMHDMKVGDVLNQSDIGVLRTEKELSVGLSPEFFDDIIGCKLCKNAISGEGVTFLHLFEK